MNFSSPRCFRKLMFVMWGTAFIPVAETVIDIVRPYDQQYSRHQEVDFIRVEKLLAEKKYKTNGKYGNRYKRSMMFYIAMIK